MLDINKKYRTREGREVRIYAVDGCGSHPVHGAVRGAEGWDAYCWMRAGSFAHFDGPLDLIEALEGEIRETAEACHD